MALRAAILAAGRGVRMGGVRPKSLIEVGEHEPLLHYILGGLRAIGVADLMVVTGFRPGQIQEYVAARWDAANLTFIRNARYASWGNFHSLRLAIDQSPGRRILAINSDVIVNPEVYRRVLEAPGDLALAVRPGSLDAEDMRVRLEDERVVAIGKELPMAASHGEFAGVSLLTPAAAMAYADIASGVEWTRDTSIYYEDVYARMLATLYARGVTVEPEEYAEVDEPADLAGAAEVVERYSEAWGERRSVSAETG